MNALKGLQIYPIWQKVQPYIKIEVYDKDGGHKHPRVRIELDSATPDELKKELLEFTMPCVACGHMIHPFRVRNAGSKRSSHTSDHIFYAPTCPLNVNIGCSRGGEARDEYKRIKAAIRPDLVS
jgi:hypothetical protein